VKTLEKVHVTTQPEDCKVAHHVHKMSNVFAKNSQSEVTWACPPTSGTKSRGLGEQKLMGGKLKRERARNLH